MCSTAESKKIRAQPTLQPLNQIFSSYSLHRARLCASPGTSLDECKWEVSRDNASKANLANDICNIIRNPQMNSKQEYPGSFKCAVGRDKLLRQLMATSEICLVQSQIFFYSPYQHTGKHALQVTEFGILDKPYV